MKKRKKKYLGLHWPSRILYISSKPRSWNKNYAYIFKTSLNKKTFKFILGFLWSIFPTLNLVANGIVWMTANYDSHNHNSKKFDIWFWILKDLVMLSAWFHWLFFCGSAISFYSRNISMENWDLRTLQFF